MDGVKEAKADFGERRIEIVFDDEIVTERKLIEAAKSLGFTLLESAAADGSPKRK